MERGAATRGKVARAIAGADAIEIKATIPDHQIRQALARFGLTSNNDEERYIYLSTPPSSTCSAPASSPAPAAWSAMPMTARSSSGRSIRSTSGRSGASSGISRSRRGRKRDIAGQVRIVFEPVAKGFIKRVAAGKKPVSAIFTAEQEAFLTAIAGHKIDFSTLAVLGPLLAQRWRFGARGLPLADHRRAVAARGRQADDGALDQGARGAGGGGGGRLHGLSRGGGCRARQEPAGQDALGTRLLRRKARAHAGGQEGCGKDVSAENATTAGTQVSRLQKPAGGGRGTRHSAFEDDAHRGAGSRSDGAYPRPGLRRDYASSLAQPGNLIQSALEHHGDLRSRNFTTRAGANQIGGAAGPRVA